MKRQRNRKNEKEREERAFEGNVDKVHRRLLEIATEDVSCQDLKVLPVDT